MLRTSPHRPRPSIVRAGKMMAPHKEPDANAGDASGALAWLARRVGIEPHFVNAMGETVVTPAAVQSALLTAMGLAAADEREAESRGAVGRARRGRMVAAASPGRRAARG
ncbi:MAG TPA: hypothetical protein VJ349_06395 [Stellaceae bacterium]|nr:hypothetical protein [Stellaceae bacterium]